MRKKDIIEPVSTVLKQDYNQVDYYDMVAISLFLFFLMKKYKILTEGFESFNLHEIMLEKSKSMTNLESTILKDATVVGLNNFTDNTLRRLFSIYEELDFSELGVFLNDYFEANATRNNTVYTSLDSIINLSKRLLNICDNSSVLDLCSGYGHFLSKVDNSDDLTGIEINSVVRVVSKINLFFSKEDNDLRNNDFVRYPRIIEGNALLENFNDKKYDVVFCEAPFGLNISSKLFDDISENYYLPLVNSRMSSAWLFVDQALKALKDDGKAVIVMNNSPLFKHSDYDYRWSLVLSGYVEMVIGLPENLLSDTKIPISLLVLNKTKSDTVSIKLIDASNEFTPGRRVNTLSTENIDNILNMIDKDYYLVDIGDLEYNDYNLNPKNYQDLVELIYPAKINSFTTSIFRGVQINAKMLDEIITEDTYSYKVLSLKDIDEFRVDMQKLSKVKVDHHKWDKYLLEDGDFIISAKGTKIKTAVFKKINDEKIIPEGNLMILKLNRDYINPYYLKILFDSKLGQKLIKRIQTGSFIISIGKAALSDLEIPLIPIEEQQQLVDEYFNKLSELNYHKRKTLELVEEIENILENQNGGNQFAIK